METHFVEKKYINIDNPNTGLLVRDNILRANVKNV